MGDLGLWIQIFSASGGITTGIAAVVVSILIWHLHRQRLLVEHERFKQELFEMRYPVYESFDTFLGYTSSNIFSPDDYVVQKENFLGCWPKVHFYFKQDVLKFYYECLRSADALAKARGHSYKLTPEIKETNSYDRVVRASEEMIHIFKPYLKLDERFM